MFIKKIFLILIFLIFVPIIVYSREFFIVKKVYDGDTILLNNGIRVRYLGLNSPEMAYKDKKKREPFAKEAKEFNKKLVEGKRVFLIFSKKRYDRYGRWLAYVFLESGKFINREIVQNGFAYCYFRTNNKRYDYSLLRAQRFAMSRRLGIWSENLKKSGLLIANTKTKVFHTQNCEYAKKIKKSYRKLYYTKWKAFWDGYAPHKACIK